jgi:hypothetical protein
MATRVLGALIPAALLLSGGVPDLQSAEVSASGTGRVRWQYDAGG